MGNKKKKSGEQLLLNEDAAIDGLVTAAPEVASDRRPAHHDAESANVPSARQRQKDKRKDATATLTTIAVAAATATLSTKKRRRQESAGDDHAATDGSAAGEHDVMKNAKKRKHDKSAGNRTVEAPGADIEPTATSTKSSKSRKAMHSEKRTSGSISDVRPPEIIREPIEQQVVTAAISAKNSRESPAMDESGTVAEQKKPSKKVKKPKKNKQTKNDSGMAEGQHAAAEADTPKVSARDAALDYLDAWKNDKDNWSFQKVRQVWLLQHMYSVADVDDDRFAILLEYLEPLKGKARAETVRKAEEMLAKADDDGAAAADGGSAASAGNDLALLRAKEIVQQLSTD